jgi:PIN domain nuclease of toxin-antitoxin system
VRYLLDTSVFVWSLSAPSRLNRTAIELVSSNTTQLYLSAASSWELAIKHKLGKLVLPSPPIEFVPDAMRDLGITALDVTHAHALAAGDLPPHHRDPFDRMLIAQALAEGFAVLTTDRVFKAYDVESVFCGAS